jgi:prolyl-tRNA synthetase
MKMSTNFAKTSRNIPSDETSNNAQLLIKAGYIHKTMAGVYSYLPLGLRMINKIENIVRKHLNNIGGQEILMNSLHPKDWWVKTDRWDADKVDVLFRLKSQTNSEYALACSHEEQVTPIIQSFIKSYKDLPQYNSTTNTYPLSVYQIQTKFRDELRSKSGIMRGREFRMKDMYDFHISQESANTYYELVKSTYLKIYEEMGLKAYAVHASGGMFTSNDSHEFQVICEAGEDEIYYNENYAINAEIKETLEKQGEKIPTDLKIDKSAEVGNIFKLGDKYTKAFNVKVADKNNSQITPIMNCHGIGTSRCMGVIAEIYNDEKGLKLPQSVAPFKVHLVSCINKKDDENMKNKIYELSQKIYSGNVNIGELAIEADDVLWDDREDIGMGEKLRDADLIGSPYQIIISSRSIDEYASNGGYEMRKR